MVKNLPANAGFIKDVGSIPRSGRSPGEGHCHPLQYSCLENPMDRGAWWATVHGIAKSWTQQKRLSMHARTKTSLSLECVCKMMSVPRRGENMENRDHPMGAFHLFPSLQGHLEHDIIAPISQMRKVRLNNIMQFLIQVYRSLYNGASKLEGKTLGSLRG